MLSAGGPPRALSARASEIDFLATQREYSEKELLGRVAALQASGEVLPPRVAARLCWRTLGGLGVLGGAEEEEMVLEPLWAIEGAAKHDPSLPTVPELLMLKARQPLASRGDWQGAELRGAAAADARPLSLLPPRAG